MMEETGEPRAKLLYLESLRGIAAVVVIFSHFAEAFFPAAVRDPAAPVHSGLDRLFYTTPLGVFLSGNFSVCLFFVMSGFVLVRPLLRADGDSRAWSAVVRRYWRLMPPVALSVLIGYGLMKAGWFTNLALVDATGAQWLGGLFNFVPAAETALWQAFAGSFVSEPAQSYNPLLWTMKIEFLGSLLIFAAAGLLRGRRWRWVAYVGLAVLLARTYYLGFVFGLMLADYATMLREGRSRLARVPAWVYMAVLAVGLVLGGYPSGGASAGTWYQAIDVAAWDGHVVKAFWHTIGALAVVLAVFYLAPVKRVLSVRPLVWLGKLSFSLYLTHMIILCSLGTWVFARVYGAGAGYGAAFTVTAVAVLGAVFGVSWAYQRWVDGPSIGLAKRIGARILAAGGVMRRWRWVREPAAGDAGVTADAAAERYRPSGAPVGRPAFAKQDTPVDRGVS